VADPLFTIVPLLSFVFLLFLKTNHHHRIRWARAGVLVSTIYLCFALNNKYIIDKQVHSALKFSSKQELNYFTTPTLLNNFLWFIAVEDSLGYHVGYRSILDGPVPFQMNYFPKNESFLNHVNDHKEVMELKKFSQGYYTVEHWGDTLVFNDLRFGQTNGWQNPKSRFAFHYYLSHPQENELIVQRGRFAGIDAESIRMMWKRIVN
jgi:inner membrane protein